MAGRPSGLKPDVPLEMVVEFCERDVQLVFGMVASAHFPPTPEQGLR
jgi:hypothetical protein